jgi:hypothetical protein
MALACVTHARRFLLAGPARSFHALNSVGKGVEAHAAKLEEAVGSDIQRLLEARTLRLKKLGIPCKHVRAPISLLVLPTVYNLQASC